MSWIRMVFHLSNALLLGVSLASGVSAQTDLRGYYASFALGVALDYDEDRLDLPGSVFDADVDLSVGYSGIVGGLGYAFGNGFRVEGALGYTRQGIASISAASAAANLGDAIYSELMLNGYYDFRRGKRFQPYVGLGVGAARLSYKGTSVTSGSGLQQVRDSDIHPAGQVILGMGWWIGRKVFASLEYNYVTSIGDVGVDLSSGASGSMHFDTNRLLFKLKYAFN